MNKRCMSKVGAVKFIVILTAIIPIFLIFLSSAVPEQVYELGEKIKINVGEIGSYTITIQTPGQKLLYKSNKPYFLFKPDYLGDYTIDIKSETESKQIFFKVVKSKKDEQNKIKTPKKDTKEIPKTNEEIDINEDEQVKDYSQIVIGVPVKWEEKIPSGKNIQIKIPKSSTNISILSNNESLEFKVKTSLIESVSNIISNEDKKTIAVSELPEGAKIEYETPAPIKKEKIISENKKEVEISSDLHYENVLAHTNIPEKFPLENKDLISVYWVEEKINLNFEAFDLDNDSLIDYIEWVVPHLSTQTFEIILISNAIHLNSEREIISNVYEEVWMQDRVTISIADGEYLRVEFEKLLDSSKDITIYASSPNNASVEVYEKDGDTKIADFGIIKEFKEYKIFLDLLNGTQDIFDLKVVGGNVSFDYVIDPSYEIHFTGFEADSTAPWDGWIDGGSDCARNTDRSYCTDTTCAGGGSWSLEIKDNAAGSYTEQTFDLSNICGGGSACNYTMLSFWAFYESSIDSGEELDVKCDGTTIWSCYPEDNNDPADDSSQCSGTGNENTWKYHTINLSNPEFGSCTVDSSVTLRFESEYSQNGEESWIDGINITGYIGNRAPAAPTPGINSTNGSDEADQDLNCFEILNNIDGDDLNVSVKWYKNNTLHLEIDYNNTYSNGTSFNSVLLSGNTTLGDNWTCSMRVHDGEFFSPWANSSELRIQTYLGEPEISLEVLWPLSSDVYVEQYKFFNVTLNLTCTQGNCGTINVTLDPIVETYNDFETGTEGFEHFPLNEKEDQWHISTESTHNGSQAWKCGDTGSGSYLIYSDSVLVTPTYDLEDNHTFDFYHYMYVENNGYDGGLLEFRINETGSWTKFTNFISGGYNAQYNDYNGGPDLVDGEDIWGDGYIGSAGSFAHVVANLSNITGENITFRFHFFADDSVVREGWYIDSVNFTTQTPSMNKGIIPVGSGSPFYTNASSNPLTSSYLNEGQSQIFTFFVNATGELDSKYYFFAYANLTSNLSNSDITDIWNVTISVDQELPNITISYPTSGDINDATPILDINLTGPASSLWYNIDGGANQTLCTNCNASNDEVLYLREADYTVNVYVRNPMGQENHESVSFTVDMNNNYYDSFDDSSYVYIYDEIEALDGNITLELSADTIINEDFANSQAWSLIGGQWQTISEELRQTQNADDAIAYYNSFTMDNDTDYNFTYDLYSTDNDYSGFVFGYENSSNYYRCQVRQQTPIDAEVVRVSNGGETTISTTSDGTSYSLSTWTEMKLEIKNHTASCYVDGVLATQATDVYYPEGKVGIYNDLNDEARHDDFTGIITGGRKSGSFTSYSIDLIDDITKFTNITWNHDLSNSNNSLKIEVSANDGTNWYEATNNSGLASIATGDDFIYRVFFDIEDLSYLSLLDLNISWSTTVEPPPGIFVEGITTPTEQDFTPIVNVTLNSSAAALTMSINGGANETICENCEGSWIVPIILEEGESQTVTFYANNSAGTYSSNETSFSVDFDKYYYDNYEDNSSVRETNDVIWDGENMTFYASTSESSPLYVWDANDQTGDGTWANSGRSTYSYRNILEASSINSSGDFVRINFISGTDGSLGINNPTICERSGSTSDCVGGTWTALEFGGATSYIIPSSSSAYTDWLEIDIDETKDYLVSFYVDGTNNAISYLSPASTMVYSASGVDYSGNENWSGLSPTAENLMYGIDGMEIKNQTLGGTANFTSHVMNTSQEINSISYTGWSEAGTNATNNITVQISVDNGGNWDTITNGGNLTGFTPGSNLLYRILYSADSAINISLNDLNITWESPPTITILYPETYVYNFQITEMNYSISYANGTTLDTCWYSLDLGQTNITITCNQNITGITSVDGDNTWFMYANDTSGALGTKSVTFTVDTSAPNITFINQTNEDGEIVNSTNPLYEGENLTINVNVTDSSPDSVWVIIWEGAIGGVQKAIVFLSNIFGNLWSGIIETNESFGERYNYTIYANDTTGLEDSYNGTFDILSLVLNLNLNPSTTTGDENISMTGYLNLSNGTAIPRNAINFWFNGTFIPLENLTNRGSSEDVLNFTEDEIEILSDYNNVTYSGGEFTLDGTNTSGSFTGILDAGAKVDWDTLVWSAVANPCSGTISYQDGDSNSYSSTEDSYVTSANQNTNYGTDTFLTVDSSPDTERSLVKFDNIIGYGLNKIPYGSTISSADLSLTVYDTGDNPNFYELLQNWNEDEVTYLYRTSADLWGSAGFASSPSINTTSLGYMSTATTGTKSLDVTSTVQRWVNRTLDNNGFAIHPIGSGNVLFRSREYATQADRPELSASFSSSDCTGVLVYARTSNDKISWTDWTEISNGGNITDDLNISRYLEYKVEMGAFNSTYNPQLQELTFNYTGAFTDSTGFFNYSFISTTVFGDYDVNVTSGFKTANANAQSTLSVQSGVAPQVALIAPTNTTWINSSSWNLTYNATDPNGDFTNATLILNGVYNASNATTISSGNNNFTITGLSSRTYNWSVNLSDVSETDQSETWEFYVDLENPEITLIYPPNNSDHSVGVINLSFSPTDNMDGNLSCDIVLDGSTIHTGISALNNTETNVSSGAIGGGAHYWNVTCYDESLRSTTSETWRFTITDTPPTVVLVSPEDNYIDTDGTMNFTYLPDDASGMDHCDLLINGAINETNDSINLGVNNFFIIPGFAEGYYNWSITCYDLSLTPNATTNRTFGVDLNAPSIILVNPDNESTSSSGIVNFQFNVTDAIDPNLNCSIYVNNSIDSNLSATSGVTTFQDSSLLNDGPNYWYVNCTDDSGYSGISETRLVTVEEPPTVFLNNTNMTYHQGNSFTIQFTPYDNTDIDSCTSYLNGVANDTVSSGISLGSVNNLEVEGLADGRYTYYINCSDSYGLSAYSEENVMFIDNNAPDIIAYYPLGIDVYTSNITFEFEAIDELSEFLVCNLTIDSVVVDANFALANATNASRNISGILDGYREWNVTCWDNATNTNTTSIFNFTKYTAPGISLISPPNASWVNTSSFNFTYFPQDDEGFSKTELIINGSVYMENQTVVTSGANNSFEVTLAEGRYNWSVNVTDITSMVGESEIWEVYVDTTAPQVDFIYPPESATVDNNNVTFTFNITENLDDSISCNLSVDGDIEFTGELVNGTNIVPILLVDGAHNWNTTCVDDAGNYNSSIIYNFTVYAPPKIYLDSPANNILTTNSTINFGYTPVDALGLTNCSIYIDGELNQTDSGVIKNVINNFTVPGVSEGLHNWSVECTDTDSNINMSLYRNFSRDLTPPFIQLNSPPNNTGIDANNVDTDFNWTATDALDTLLTCNLTVDGNIEDSGFATSGVPRLESVSGLSVGQHYWNVSCADSVGNTNTSLTYVFNRTYPDLQINQSQIFFNSTTPAEGENITITATVHNLALIDATSVQVEFYSGDPDTTGTQIGTTQTIPVSALNSTNASITWSAEIGATQIFVKVDPSDLITENSETNNKANKTITVSSWHLFYGEINSDSESKLADSLEAKVVTWNGTGINSKIYVADYDSNVDWTALQAIGKTPSGTNSTNDIQEIDTILNSSTFPDSLEVLYLNAGEINETQDLIIFGKQIQYIPVATSIDSQSFKTGILWDYSDDTDSEYDTTEKEDIIFVTKISKDTAGSYEVTDYELRVPALLRNYHTAEQTTAAFYMEIN